MVAARQAVDVHELLAALHLVAYWHFPDMAFMLGNVCSSEDSVEKVFLGWRMKFFRTADALRTR
jgi:hypothetical protein